MDKTEQHFLQLIYFSLASTSYQLYYKSIFNQKSYVERKSTKTFGVNMIHEMISFCSFVTL